MSKRVFSTELLKAEPGEEEEESDEDKAMMGEEPEDDEDDEDTTAGEPDDEEDEDMGDKANKSQITSADFEKSLDKLAGLAAEGGGGESRKTMLLEKAQIEDLDVDERAELYGLLGGQVEGDGTPSLSKSATAGLENNETLRQAYDVSDFLAEQHMELTKSISTLGEAIESDSARQHQFNLVLAKAVVDTGNLVKSMAERMNIMSSQPARAPKSQGAQPLNKSFVGGGQAPDGELLSKSQILDAMDEMMQKSLETGAQGMSPKGVDINLEVAKYESQNRIHPVMLDEVKAFISSKGNGR